ncbi:MAG: CvpA family protein [Planctomycetota bacterium]|nr:CvpA family protein [Planctomycetota bacterium]
MQTYDVIMLVILGVSVFFGFLKGFAWQIASVAAFSVSYFVAVNFNGQVADYFGINPLVAMFGLFLATALGIWIGYGMVHKQIERFQLKSFDRQIGAVVGLGTGIILCLVVTFFAVMLGEEMGRKVVKSKSGKYITQVIHRLDGILPEEIEGKVRPYLEQLDSELADAQTSVENNPELGDDKSLVETAKDSLSDHEKLIQEIEAALAK